MKQMNISIEDAVQSASEIAESFATLPAEKRAAMLDTIAERVDALGDELTEVANRETSLPAGRLQGERGRTVNQLRLFAQVVREGSWVDARIDRAQPDREPMPKPDLRRMLWPIGPVAVFGASNFPLAFSVAGGDTASALAAGCPVICKAHPAHPETSELVAKAIHEAATALGLPEHVFTLIHTDTNEQNLELVRHPALRGVGFTGSHAAGRSLFDAANHRLMPIPVFAEMGSVNPTVLLTGAIQQHGETLAKSLQQSFTLGVGQFCTNPGVVFLLAGESTEPWIDQLTQLSRDTPTAPMLHDGVAQGYRKALDQLAGAKGVTTCTRVDAEDDQHGGAAVLRTTASQVVNNPDLLDECFGPATLLVVAQNLDELAAAVNTLPGQLTATLHATDADDAATQRLVPLLRERCGRLLFGGFPTGVEVCPSMQHGGPYPATTDSRFTSVGTAAILRWARPICYQSAPAGLLPPELRDENPRGIWRTIDGERTRDAL